MRLAIIGHNRRYSRETAAKPGFYACRRWFCTIPRVGFPEKIEKNPACARQGDLSPFCPAVFLTKIKLKNIKD
jgi:hypothetical protein